MDLELVGIDEPQFIKEKHTSPKKEVTTKHKTSSEKTFVMGYELKSVNDITMNDLSRLCEKLYSVTGNKVEPERVTGGGLFFSELPNKQYKTMRLRFGPARWPCPPENVIKIWRDDESIILPKGNTITTTLRSFHGAPLWTLDELKLWEKYLNEIGLHRVGSYPTKTSLITRRKICGEESIDWHLRYY
jgi:hypothetical protein